MRSSFHLLLAVLLSLFLLVSADSYCGTTYNVTNVDPTTVHKDAMTYLRFALARPWPPVDTRLGQLRLVRYCYTTAVAKEELSCAVQAGFKVWADAIGFPAGEKTGHSLS